MLLGICIVFNVVSLCVRFPTHLESQVESGKVREFGQGKSGNLFGGQGILIACERKRQFLSTFQGKVATR